MKKLLSTIAMFMAISAFASAQTAVNLGLGYHEKTIELGRVVNERGVYTSGVDASWKSFHFGLLTESSGNANGISLARTNVLVGYKFFSTLVDVEAGDQVIFKQNAGKHDATPHNRPFVKAFKGPLSFTLQRDVQSDATNGQLDYSAKAMKVGPFSIKPSAYVGYTAAYNWLNNLPQNVRKLKFNDSYYGVRAIASWKAFYAGVDAIHVGSNSKNTLAFQLGLTHKL